MIDVRASLLGDVLIAALRGSDPCVRQSEDVLKRRLEGATLCEAIRVCAHVRQSEDVLDCDAHVRPSEDVLDCEVI